MFLSLYFTFHLRDAALLSDVLRRPILLARVIAKRIREIPEKGVPKILFRRDDGFDKKYGIDTFPLVYAVKSPSSNLAFGHRYEASSEATARWILDNCALRYEETVFIDVGCGKGRVLVIAAEYPFKKIIGIEYSPELAKICRDNLMHLGLESRCEVVVSDAADFEFPNDNLLAFFYNPFDSVVLKRVLTNLAAVKGNIRIAYHGSGKEIIESHPGVRSLSFGEDATLFGINR